MAIILLMSPSVLTLGANYMYVKLTEVSVTEM